MRTGYLSTVVVGGALLMGCGGGAATCPEPAAPKVAAADKKEPVAAAPVEAAAPPQLEGSFRVVEFRQGETVTDVARSFLSQAPNCYAARMLWTFQKEALGVSMDLVCDTSKTPNRSVDLCQASLELGIRWTRGGFEIPVAARAEGTVDRYTLEFEKIPGGMRRSRDAVNRSCNVSLKAGALTIKQEGDTLVLGSPEGDLVLAAEPVPEPNWGEVVQRLYEERHGAK